jgi:cyanophycin synthetase
MMNAPHTSDHFSEAHIEERIRIQLAIKLPEPFDIENYQRWASAMIQKKNWLEDLPPNPNHFDDSALSVFIASHLQIIRQLFQWVRVPIFDPPKIQNFLPRNTFSHANPAFDLELELSFIHGITPEIYQTIGQFTLRLCRWLASHEATAEHKARVFTTIEQRILHQLGPGIRAGQSTIPVLRVAHERGIPIKHLGLGIYQLGWGSQSRRLDRSSCELDSAMGSKLAQNKLSTAQILRAAGLPAPTHVAVNSLEAAIHAAHQIRFPLVIKPNDRDRGEGVTVDVNDQEQVETAYNHAHHFSKSKQVIIERQVEGICHRVFVANGKLLYCVKRHPISVIGDGEKTVHELFEETVKNQAHLAPWDCYGLQAIDGLAIEALKKISNLTPQSVPVAGQMVPLRRIESTEWGGTDENVTTTIHPENVQLALDVTQLFGLSTAGIDIISPDISSPWFENHAIVNEVNYAPLFGGAAISRSYISTFFDSFIQGDGKIPIDYFNTYAQAHKCWSKQIESGKRSYLITSDKTLNSFGREIKLVHDHCLARLRALLLRQDVDSIVVCKSGIGDAF